MAASDELHRLYPGHHDPELMLFVQDATTTAIINLNETKYAPTVTNSDCLSLAGEDIPDGALQVIRLRARTPSTAYPIAARETEFDALVSLFDKLNFPLQTVLMARQESRVEFGRQIGQRGDSDEHPIFYAAGSRVCMVWSHNLQTRSTVAVLLNFMAEGASQSIKFSYILSATLQMYRACFEHPMLLALVLTHFIQADTMASYGSDSQTLRHIENRITIKSANRIETMQRLRDLGRLSAKDKYTMSVLLKIMKFCLDVEDYYSDGIISIGTNQLSKTFRWYVNQRIGLIELDNQFLDSISNSVSNQLASLSTILNMQDGASMKTMATITMLFLPATFVASFFAMPMFTWDDQSGEIVSREFWMYWVVAIPLTVAIVLAWLGWYYLRNSSMFADTLLYTSCQHAWGRLEDKFGVRAKRTDHRKQEASDRLGPLHVDTNRNFEENFYNLQPEQVRRHSRDDLAPSPIHILAKENV